MKASGFDVGDRVMGTTLGAFAPFALVDHRHVVSVPASLSWTDAAALPVGLTTEHDALVTQAGFEAGQSVLVTGGRPVWVWSVSSSRGRWVRPR